MKETKAQAKKYRKPVVVAGATGQQGGAVAEQLLANGHAVRALTRDPDKPQAKVLASLGAEVVAADLEDRDTLDRALKGAGAVFSVQSFLEAGVEAEVRQGLNLIEAAVAAELEHIVYSSACATDRNTGVPHLESKWKIEQNLRETTACWTVFRPAAFMENWIWDREAIEQGVLSLPVRPDLIYRQVSVIDIAAMVVQALEHPAFWGERIVPLAGDDLTPKDIAKTFAKVLKREVRYEQMPWSTCLQMFGEELTVMYRYFDDFGLEGDPQMLRHWHSEALSFEAYLRQSGWGGTA